MLPQVQQQLNNTAFKKIKTEPVFEKKTQENIPNIPEQTVQKTEDFFIDDDEFDEYKKTETINIKQPSTDDRNDFVIIPGNEKAEISKSLLKTEIQIKGNLKWKKQKNRKPYRKLITEENLQDALDVSLANIQTVNYNDDTSLDDLETVGYNNDTSVTNLVPVQKLKTIKEDENNDIEVIKMVQRVVIGNDDDDNDAEFLKQRPLHPRHRLKRSEKKYLQILTRKKLIQRSKNQRKEIEYIKNASFHPRECLKQ